MRDTDYAYCVARLRASESKMLSERDYKNLIEAESYFDAVNYLKEKGYTDGSVGMAQIIAFQNESLWNLLSESVPEKKELDALCILNDFFNIKAAVKCFFSGEDAEDYYIRPTTLELEGLTKAINSLDFSFMGMDMGATAKEAYETVCRTGNGQNGAIIIDKAAICALKHFSERKNRGKNNLINEICAFLCDTANIKISLRLHRAKKGRDFAENSIGDCVFLDREKLLSLSIQGDDSLIEYLKSTKYSQGIEIYEKAPVEFERWCDDEIVRICADAKYTCFGFDPVCSYYYSRIREIKHIGVILSCKLSGVPVAERIILKESAGTT